MLWVYICMWAIGASLVVYGFAVGVGGRKGKIGTGLFVLGVLFVAVGVYLGNAHNAGVHGVRPDEAPELMIPGGS